VIGDGEDRKIITDSSIQELMKPATFTIWLGIGKGGWKDYT
jgi:hypothetical protein